MIALIKKDVSLARLSFMYNFQNNLRYIINLLTPEQIIEIVLIGNNWNKPYYYQVLIEGISEDDDVYEEEPNNEDLAKLCILYAATKLGKEKLDKLFHKYNLPPPTINYNYHLGGINNLIIRMQGNHEYLLDKVGGAYGILNSSNLDSFTNYKSLFTLTSGDIINYIQICALFEYTDMVTTHKYGINNFGYITFDSKYAKERFPNTPMNKLSFKQYEIIYSPVEETIYDE